MARATLNLLLLPLLFLVTDCHNFSEQITHNIEALVTKIWSHVNHTSDPHMIVLKMFDASAKIPAGLMLDVIFDLGNFGECYNIHSGDVYGKYCLGMIPSDAMPLKNLTNKNTKVHPYHELTNYFALCLPDTMGVKEIPGGIMFDESFCYSKRKEPDLSTGAIITLAIFSTFTLVVATSTAFDIVIYYKHKGKNHDSNKLFVSFSLLSNGRKLLRTSSNTKEVLCLNGLKAISILWVVAGHEGAILRQSVVKNLEEAYEWRDGYLATVLHSTGLAVDTFLMIGGLTTAYMYLNYVQEKGKINISLYYLHRYLRLTPSYGFVCLFTIFLLQHVATGPFWRTVETQLVDTCKDTWWMSLLYITPYFKREGCLPQSWYLAVDMQLYVLAPLVLVPLSKWPKIGLSALGLLIAAGLALPFAVTYVQAQNFAHDSTRYQFLYYIQTYTRFGPYVIGMMMGYVIYKFKTASWNLRLSPVISFILWSAILTGLVFCVETVKVIEFSIEEAKLKNSILVALHRSGWAALVSLAVFLCATEHGGPIDVFLSLPLFQFLNKVGYSIYLLHFNVIAVRYASLKNGISGSESSWIQSFIGDYMVTLMISTLWCLIIESPIVMLEKIVFDRRKMPSKPLPQ